MFDISFDVAPAVDLLRRLRGFSSSISGEVYKAIHGPIHDHVEKDVLDLLAPYPEQSAVHPFEFATDTSRAFYFWARRKGGYFGSQSWDPTNNDASWLRTNTLLDSWYVTDANVSANESFIQIGNNAVDEQNHEYAEAVYGGGDPAVPGHFNTGWGTNQADAIDQIMDNLELDIITALEVAIKGF